MTLSRLTDSLRQYIQSYQSRLERISSYENSINPPVKKLDVTHEITMLTLFIHILKGLDNILIRRELISKDAQGKGYLDGYIEGILKGTTIASELLLEDLISNIQIVEQGDLTIFYQIFDTFSAQIWMMLTES